MSSWWYETSQDAFFFNLLFFFVFCFKGQYKDSDTTRYKKDSHPHPPCICMHSVNGRKRKSTWPEAYKHRQKPSFTATTVTPVARVASCNPITAFELKLNSSRSFSRWISTQAHPIGLRMINAKLPNWTYKWRNVTTAENKGRMHYLLIILVSSESQSRYKPCVQVLDISTTMTNWTCIN